MSVELIRPNPERITYEDFQIAGRALNRLFHLTEGTLNNVCAELISQKKLIVDPSQTMYDVVVPSKPIGLRLVQQYCWFPSIKGLDEKFVGPAPEIRDSFSTFPPVVITVNRGRHFPTHSHASLVFSDESELHYPVGWSCYFSNSIPYKIHPFYAEIPRFMRGMWQYKGYKGMNNLRITLWREHENHRHAAMFSLIAPNRSLQDVVIMILQQDTIEMLAKIDNPTYRN